MALDVIFIQAGEQIQVDMDSIYVSSVEMVPLGILYLATILENYGFSVKVYDFSLYSPEKQIEIIKKIIREEPRCIAISSSTTSYFNAMNYAKIIKTENPKIKIIMGGYHVTFLPDEPLKLGYADVVMRGESEDNIIPVINSLIRNDQNTLHKTKSISFISKGKIIHNLPNLNIITNLDQVPYPKRDFIDINKYRNAGTVISSRGCVAKCQFCAAGAFGKIRCRSADNVAYEIKEIYDKYGMNHFFFVDNTFSSNRKRAINLFEKLDRLGVEASYALESRVTEVDEEYIKFLKANNVYAIQFGVESGNDSVLKSINKYITLDQVRKAVSLCLNNGIRVTCSFVIGHPTDTKDSVKDTIKFAKEMKRMGAMIAFGIMTPYPGTEAYNKRNELGITIEDWDFRKWDLSRAVARNKYLSTKQIELFYYEATTEINVI